MKILDLTDIPYASDCSTLARAINKDRTTVWRAVRSGALNIHKTPEGKTIFLRPDVLRWLGIPAESEPTKPAKPLHGVKRRAWKKPAAR